MQKETNVFGNKKRNEKNKPKHEKLNIIRMNEKQKTIKLIQKRVKK